MPSSQADIAEFLANAQASLAAQIFAPADGPLAGMDPMPGVMPGNETPAMEF
jgi:hypothetical protein